MSLMHPLTTNLLDLLFDLREYPVPLTIGGFGLYLKRMRLDETRERTLFPQLPLPRATNDLDLFIRADVLCDLHRYDGRRNRCASTVNTSAWGCVTAVPSTATRPPGLPKQLNIQYRNDGKPGEVSLPESTTIVLRVPRKDPS